MQRVRCAYGHYGCRREHPVIVCVQTKDLTCPFHVGGATYRDRRTGYRLNMSCVGCRLAQRRARAKNNAARPALYDQVAVDRALDSCAPLGMSRVERQEVVRVLTERGLSATVIAVRLRVAPRTVQRLRARIRNSGDA